MKWHRCFARVCAAALGTLSSSLMAGDGGDLPRMHALDFRNFGVPGSRWFHPGVTVLPDGRWLAVMQSISGADFYGDPHYALSADGGKHWTKPLPIGSFAAVPAGNTGYRTAIADIRPFTSPEDGTVFVFGCSVHYSPRGNTVWEKGKKTVFPPQRSFYATWREDRGWSECRKLPLPGHEGAYRAACTQAAFLPGRHEVLVPMYLEKGTAGTGAPRPLHYAVAVGRYRQKGDTLEFVSLSDCIEHPAGRGALEPSLIALPGGGFALTIRAEDGRGYVCVSPDGTKWSEKRFWRWDDGTPLTMSSTQQHWVRADGRIWLVYTRDDGENSKIFRFRAPLYMAEALPEKGVLLRSTEKVVIPRQKLNGREACYGNFHCTRLTDRTALVTDAGIGGGETRVMATLIAL